MLKRTLIAVSVIVGIGFSDQPFMPNVRVSVDPPNYTVNQGESSFTVWKDSIYVICNIAERSVYAMIPFARSIDGGDTFDLHYNFIDNTTGITWHTDPVIGVDDSGHVHMLVQFSTDLIKHYLSRDGGVTWAESTLVTDPTTGGWVDKPWMVVYNNFVFVAWQEIFGSQEGIRFAWSSDYGRTFNRTRVDISTGLVALNINKNTGKLYLAYIAWGYGIYFTYSTTGGTQWATPQYLENVYYSSGVGDRAPINSLAVFGDTLFFTWVDDRYGTWDILGLQSLDAGNTWNGPFNLTALQYGGQCKGWATYDPYGGLHVFYYHTPDWPTNIFSQWSVWYRYSPDFGTTFFDPIRITDTTFLGYYYSDNTDFMGDYHMILADSQYIYAVWTDGRDGNMNLYFSKAALDEVSVLEKPANPPTDPVVYLSGNGIIVNLRQLREGEVSFDLFDASGRAVFSEIRRIAKGVTRINLEENLTPGIYFLRVQQGNRFSTFRVPVLPRN